MPAPTLSEDEAARNRFHQFVKKVISVPNEEIKKRELKWKNDRKKHETHKRHR